MYNEQNYSDAKKITYAVILLVIIGIIISFIVIVCSRLSHGGSLIKEDMCSDINPATAKQISPEWLERNCPEFVSETADADQ